MGSDATPYTPVDPAAPRQGSKLGKYVLLESAGQGGMSTVWQAWDEELKRRVALKILNLAAIPDAGGADRRRFILEARTLARIEHPNIVPIYDVGQEGDHQYITMKWIEGQTGVDLAPSLTARRAAEIIRDAARGMHHMHLNGVVHRDLKPGNIMIDKTGQTYVMDFGLAQDLIRQRRGKPRLTQTGLTVGTPAYMSPEQARGRLEEVDAKSDVFSLGATLYTLSTKGAMPFADPNVDEAMMNVIHRDPINPRSVRHDLPVDLCTIMLHALEKDRRRRYPTAAALADDLDRFLRDEPIVAEPPSITDVLVRKARRNRPALVIGIASAILLAAAATALVLMYRSNVRRDRELARAQEEKDRAERDRLLLRNSALERAMVQLRAAEADSARSEEPCRIGMEECAKARMHDPAEPTNYWIAGRLLEIRGMSDEAIEAFTAAIARHADYKDAYRDRGRLLLERYLHESGELAPFLQQHGTIELGPKPDLAPDAPAALRRVTQDFDRLRELASTPAERAYAEGMLETAERRPPLALEKFKECPEVPDVPRWRAYALYCAGRYDDAAGEWDLWLDSHSADAHAHLFRAFCDMGRTGGFERALERCVRAAAADPRCAHAQYTAGLIHQAHQRLPEAEAAYARVLALDPSFYYAYLNRGMIWHRKNDSARMLEDCAKLIELRPKASVGYNRRASAYYMKGDISSAIADYSRAIDLNPKYYWGYFNRGRMYRELKEFVVAIRDFSEASRLVPTMAGPLVERGFCHYSLGKWAEAVGDFERAVALDASVKPQVNAALLEARRRIKTD